MANKMDKDFVLKKLKELKEDVKKVKKIMYEQNGNMNKENTKKKSERNSEAEKYNK